jgi:hypothetical protein
VKATLVPGIAGRKVLQVDVGKTQQRLAKKRAQARKG